MTPRLLLAAAMITLGILACIPASSVNVSTGSDSTDQPIFDPNLTVNNDANSPTDIDFGDVVISGAIRSHESGQTAPGADAYTVFIASDTTGEIYSADVDGQGEFRYDLPDSEAGSTFIVTIADSLGKSLGPVLFDNNGSTGVKPIGTATLGVIELPTDPNDAPITPGPGTNTAAMIASTIQTRLDPNGVPVGVQSKGKGEAAETALPASGKVDIDRDGLIAIFDADDDGDGIVDDFDSSSSSRSDIRVNFFMNLKISAEDASTYYEGTTAAIEAARAVDTIITFEVIDDDPNEGSSLASVTMYETPNPAYIPTSDLQTEDGGLQYNPWSDTNFAFEEATDRFQAFVRPNDLMEAGDTFRIAVTYEDGVGFSTWRMINFVFTNIPKLIKFGSPLGLTPFDIANTTINGTPSKPIRFDNTRDLVLEFEPPVDETGSPLTDIPQYKCQVFYIDENGDQINGNIDVDATFGALPNGVTTNLAYVVDTSSLTYSADGTYEITIPMELFPDSVTQKDSSTENVDYFKVDLTAESDGGNAAIMLSFNPY